LRLNAAFSHGHTGRGTCSYGASASALSCGARPQGQWGDMDDVFRDRGFLIHLAAYVVVNIGLIAINVIATPNTWWFYWPLLGWGIGIIAHGIALYYSQRPRA